ncbi:MAG TPA: FG-GAP repeat protein, partial [Bryobacteraceae bacterium]|nr:FG-GAP repeat protein [Bryobacteraceae bacterium]
MSAALGRDDARYQVATADGKLRTQNPAQGLSADFTQAGVRVLVGKEMRWSLAPLGYGYGDRIAKVHAATPRGEANRVEYRRGSLVEWYVNGPLGLEQGFTLAAPPANPRNADGSPLTIVLGLGGELRGDSDSPAKVRARNITLRDGAGSAVLRYSGLEAHDANGRALIAWLELSGEELRLRVQDSGARYPVVVDPFIQVAKLTASDGAASDGLGYSVGISGDDSTIVAGAYAATINGNSYQGAAYVFVKPGGGWTTATQTAKLTASDGASNNKLGQSVGVSSDGSTIVASAPNAKVGSNFGQGAAYVFV